MELLPRVVKFRQEFNTPILQDVTGRVHGEIARFAGEIQPGAQIAVAVGSRGIRNLREIVTAVVNALKERGAKPFIVPAMGSHGGATAKGQTEVIASYGITEENLQVPVRATMDTVEIGFTSHGVPVYFDRIAAAADGIVLVNRIKPHTDFRSPVESGLMKMLAIGLGKQKGAELIHSHGVKGLQTLIAPIAQVAMNKLPVLFGIGILENARDDTAEIFALNPGEIVEREPGLLLRAKGLLPRLPVDDLDVLVVREMGKNISGTGIDPNIIGRIGIRGQQDEAVPRISRIAALDLTEESHGNALGMGLADVITRRLRDKADLEATYANVITTAFLERGFMPVVVPSDRAAVYVALKTCGRQVDAQSARLLIIQNTLAVEEAFASEALLPELKEKTYIEILGVPETIRFNEAGELLTRLS